MTFRLDVAGARAGGGARPARARRCSTSPAEPATSASTWLARRASADLVRPQLRHAGRRSQRRAPRAGRHLAAAAPDRLGRRRDVRVRAAQPGRSAAFFDELGRVVRRRPDRPARRRCPTQRDPAGGNNIYFGKVVPQIGGLLSDGAAYRYLPKSVAYLPPPARDARRADRRRVCRRRTSPAVGGITQLAHGDPGCAPSPAGSIGTSTSTTSPAATGTSSSATASGGRPRRGRTGSHRRRRRQPLRRSSRRRSDGRPAPRPRRGALRARITLRAGGPAMASSRPPTAALGDHDRRGRVDLTAGARSPRGRRRVHAAARLDPTAFRPRSPRPGPRARRAAGEGGHRPRGAGEAEPIDIHAVLVRLRASFGSSYLFAVDGFVGASPELLVARQGDIVRAQPIGRHHAAHRRSRRPTPAGGRAPRQHQEPDRAPGHDRHGPRHVAAVVQLPRLGAGAVDRRRGQRAAPRHRSSRGGCRTRRRRCWSSVAALHRRRPSAGSLAPRPSR